MPSFFTLAEVRFDDDETLFDVAASSTALPVVPGAVVEVALPLLDAFAAAAWLMSFVMRPLQASSAVRVRRTERRVSGDAVEMAASSFSSLSLGLETGYTG